MLSWTNCFFYDRKKAIFDIYSFSTITILGNNALMGSNSNFLLMAKQKT